MKAAIIAIGGELTNGHTLDTNSQWIAQQLSEWGFDVEFHCNIPDTAPAITRILHYVKEHYSIALMTGGLGPTKDDITKLVLCDFFQDTMIPNETYKHILEAYYTGKNRVLPVEFEHQYSFPSKATLLCNKMGTAPGLYFKEDGFHLFAMPGVPFEMKYIVGNEISPVLSSIFQKPLHLKHSFQVGYIGEVSIEEKVAYLLDQYPDLYFSYLPQFSSVTFSVTTLNDRFDVPTFKLIVDTIRNLLTPYIYSEIQESVAQAVIRNLKKHQLSIGCAESCSGGIIGHLLTNVEGSSDAYMGSLNTYSNSAKINILGVDQELIERYTAISEQVAVSMAQNAQRMFQSHLGISTTGYIEKNDSIEKAFVHTAITNGSETEHHKIILPYDRDTNKMYLANQLLYRVWQFIETHY